MKISLTIAVDDRKLSKTYNKLYPELKVLTTQLSSYEPKHPIGEVITVIVTDTEKDGYFREDSKDGTFTYFFGMEAIHDEALLKTKLLGYLETAIEKTAFTLPDHEKYKMIFSQWKKDHM
ncbi:hypothetical protein [Cronobacter malonaticus]|uniref:Uncharacterized protein n=1 Tax=Cronobacter malonaticus TaxID=413503 RepID=A0A423XQ73_9ENTR|nr:hypothetical protein [Cronobacter malonaticus]ELY4601480.1 hypothetical protein [Cronobacter malonaticus]MDI6460592.1 hypothetical protein [Cronobacter malonaticus]ROW58530.1 hypothetical protein C3E80_20880 [Cronobacter malonaticus]RRA40123.1 hypothetical protein C4882_14295 [Cronobacter malonaticus]HAU5432697.1 hypothetical protein [Cronobacter malonaticus]